MSRVGETDTAYAGRDAAFHVTPEASWIDPARADEAIAWGRECWAALERHSTGGVYLNFPGFGEKKDALARAGYGVDFERSPHSRRSTTPRTCSARTSTSRPHARRPLPSSASDAEAEPELAS